MTGLSKTEQVLKYFAQQYKLPPSRNGIPRKRLVKMAYMADVLAREYLGRPITDLDYHRNKFGPYDESIKAAIGDLVEAGLAEVRVEWEGDYQTKRLVDSGKPVSFTLTAAEMEILRYVAANYLHMPMAELLRDVVYQTLPMQDTPMDQRLPMNLLDNRGVDAVGFDLEEVLRAEAEIDAGNFSVAI